MNSAASNRNMAILVLGDLIAYLFSLVITLIVRYGTIPSSTLLARHIPAFSVLIVIFLIVNLGAGLYDKQSSLIRNRIIGLILNAQIFNVLLGVVFFYFIPASVTPKANLFIYFLISTIILYIWRLAMFPVMSSTKKYAAILVGAGADIDDLQEGIQSSINYGFVIKGKIVPEGDVEKVVSKIADAVKETGASIIIADLHDRTVESAMPFLYGLIFSGVQVIDASRLYESIFDRIPVSLVGERWLVENSSTSLGRRRTYDMFKRTMDIVITGIIGTLSLIVYPFVYIAIKIEDGGSIFITQERIGKNGKPIKIIKFRSMSGDDGGKYGTFGATKLVVTKVGKIIRVTRIDELPQLWNVVKGDLSLIGPRPELPSLVTVYETQVPYYNARHLVKPGLSGWAQIYHEHHPHHEVDATEARNKLYYDLYYVKNRSSMLDLKIALRTVQILLRRAGR